MSRFMVQAQENQAVTIQNMCQMLDLPGTAASFSYIAERMNQSHGTLYDFLEGVLEKELLYKEEQRIQRWMQQAHFPFKKTIDEFDFSFQPGINERQIRELGSCRFVEEGKNVIFLGAAGVGKTHLSIALGIEAIQRGYDVRFLRIDELIDRVEREVDIIASAKLFTSYVRPRLLILDDIDFYETGKNASTVLFKLICYRYDRQLSTIFTSNKDLQGWMKLFGDVERANAAIDRIIGNAEKVVINGESYRVKDKLKNKEIIV